MCEALEKKERKMEIRVKSDVYMSQGVFEKLVKNIQKIEKEYNCECIS